MCVCLWCLLLCDTMVQSHACKSRSLICCLMQSRALWLVGACGQDLPHADWCRAYKLMVAHMASVDIVVGGVSAYVVYVCVCVRPCGRCIAHNGLVFITV